MANQVVFKYGTREQYDGLATKAANALYFLTDTGEIYRGDVNLARGSHYEGERNKVNDVWETDLEVISRVFASISTPEVVDDIFVIKTPIGETGKYSYSSFVYDGTNWCAMDGNYDATNVIFDSNLTVTENIGAFEIPDGQNSAELLSAGKSLKWVLENILAQELQPVRESSPTVTNTVKANGSTTRSYEVGTKVIPSWVASLSAGSYTYGPATGITASSYSVSSTGRKTVDGATSSTAEDSATTASGAFDSFIVDDDTNYKLSVSIPHNAGVVAHDNLGTASNPTVQIAAGNKSANGGYITGYRAWFMYVGNSMDEVNSAFIRRTTNMGATPTTQMSVSIPKGTKRVMVAIPVSSSFGLTGVTDVDGMGLSVFGNFTLSSVNVEGVSGYMAAPYNVWVADNANGVDATHYDLIIG